MSSAKPQPAQVYPNNLRAARRANRITQEDLAARCAEFAKDDPATYSSVSVTTVSDLERGKQRPQRRRAHTIAMALQTTVEALFPLGCDDPNHNKHGKTTPSPHSRGGGRPKGSKNRHSSRSE